MLLGLLKLEVLQVLAIFRHSQGKTSTISKHLVAHTIYNLLVTILNHLIRLERRHSVELLSILIKLLNFIFVGLKFTRHFEILEIV